MSIFVGDTNRQSVSLIHCVRFYVYTPRRSLNRSRGCELHFNVMLISHRRTQNRSSNDSNKKVRLGRDEGIWGRKSQLFLTGSQRQIGNRLFGQSHRRNTNVGCLWKRHVIKSTVRPSPFSRLSTYDSDPVRTRLWDVQG